MIRSFFARLDCWLRDKPYPEPAFYSGEDVFEDLFDGPPDPWQTKIYWVVRRRAKALWELPYNIRTTIKWAYQRLTRGWDDRATWSIDYWLDDKMPDMLRQLKANKHGTPNEMFPTGPEFMDEDGNPNEAGWAIATPRWEAIMDKMIAGFEASRRVKAHDYDAELGHFSYRRPKNICKKHWKIIKHQHFLAMQELEKRDETIFKEGMALFAEHYWSLWD